MDQSILISTDWHLKEDNVDLIKHLAIQKRNLAKKLGIKKLFILGDVFHNRISQKQQVLSALHTILVDIFYGYEVYIIPGNHDKTDYNLKESFLDCFSAYKKVISNYEYLQLGDVRFHFMPFFKENIWIEEFTPKLNNDCFNILLTHIAITGSKNNDGSLVESSLNAKMFEKFDLVLSGHYHNKQKIGENFYHIPSICQHNYGEDKEKGFTILHNDNRIELYKSTFPTYEKIIVNVDEKSKKEIDSIVEKYKDKDNCRIELIGSESNINSIDKNKILSQGIDVKAKINEIEDTSIQGQITEKITDKRLKEEFKEFCEKEKLNFKEGLELLKN
jgi:exonuclease SbcD